MTQVKEFNVYTDTLKRVKEHCKKYQVEVDLIDDDTFADWVYSKFYSGYFNKWESWEVRDIFLLQWMTDVIAGSFKKVDIIVRKEI